MEALKCENIKEETKISLPDTRDVKRTRLEKTLKEVGKWDEVSSLDVRKFSK